MLVGALWCVGRGFGRAGRAGPGWAQIWLCLARSAGLGVGPGIWPCWARWAGLGVGFGSGGRAGLGWAWDLAMLGVLCWAGLGGVWLW